MADVNWVTFPGGEAVLKRLLDGKGNPGLLLRVAGTSEGAEVARKAEESGFEPRPSLPGLLTMVFERGRKVPYSTTDIAEMIGGVITPMPRERILSGDMLVDLSRVARARATGARPGPVETIGLNLRGQEVCKAGSERYQRLLDDEGRTVWRRENGADQPALWLRAKERGDLAGIAAGVLRMAGKARLGPTRLEAVLDAALEDGVLDMERAEAAQDVRGEMLRQIVARGMEDGADANAFHAALRLSMNAGWLTARADRLDGDLHPGAMFTLMLRRATREYNEVDFAGHDGLDPALPRLRGDDARLQLHDLSGRESAGVTDYALNVLARRPASGTSVFILPEHMAEADMEAFRARTAQSYGLECVADVSRVVSDGVVANRDVHVAFVGDRRPDPLEGVPKAALRTFSVRSFDELLDLEREILRSRRRIREFNLDEAGQLAPSEEADDREENIRQRPYRPLSQTGEPFTMIPRALEGASMRALDRVADHADPVGGVDAMVANAMGCSIAELGNVLTPEQVDAVGMRMIAAERGRGFLEADQTGVGKGRTLAAIMHAHLRDRAGRRCLYVTESAEINIPDVMRDIKAVSGLERFRVKMLSAGSRFTEPDGEGGRIEILSDPPAERRRIFESGEWPEDTDIAITTYSQFNGREDSPRSEWLASVADADPGNLLLVMDEAHNALNPKANVGRNFRSMIDRLAPENVVFATGTPARNPNGMDLYGPLLPGEDKANDQTILTAVASGGQVAQEAFATMLADDGVMIRRDHDLSATTYQVSLPDDRRMIQYQEVMDRFSPIVEAMIDASVQIDRWLDRARHREYQGLIRNGMDHEIARMRTAERTGGSMSLGSPLSNLARVTMNALKVEQMAETAIAEMEQGRKPLIVFHSTNAGVLEDASRGPDGARLDRDALAELPPMTIRDQVRRLHDRLYMAKVANERRDVRDLFGDLAAMSDRVEGLIDALPDLPVSPVDAVIERLEAAGLSTGEISGRSLCYRGGRIMRRQGKARRATVDAFNRGDIDALLYNSAGATGGSYHAGKTFLDQRPRSLIEFEAPTDIIKYVQAQGRGNRFDQVEAPKVVSVMTGLTPEMRILQQRNGKLRSLGATVDGNRAHPLLLDDVPDLLNAVGDEAAANVLAASPTLARRMGFRRFADERVYAGDDVDRGASVSMGLANQLLTRSIMLPALQQDNLVRRIRMEFDVLVEDLNSRNANPLKPKEISGRIDIKATSLFQGQEDAEGADVSAFHAPVHISTGNHVRESAGLAGEELIAMVERGVRLRGPDGLVRWGERITQNMADLLRPWLPDGVDLARMLENPDMMVGRLKSKHDGYYQLAFLLSNMKPGVNLDTSGDLLLSERLRTVVDVIPPDRVEDSIHASAYRIKTICPGQSRPEVMSLARLMQQSGNVLRMHPGLSEGFDETYLRDFTEAAKMDRRMPVQILSGNTLQAIGIAKAHSLGTISLYRDMEGRIHRGIVVEQSKTNLEHLPVHVPNTDALRDVARCFVAMGRAEDREAGMMRIWGSMDPEEMQKRDEADIIIRLTNSNAVIDMVPLRVSTARFYKSRDGLYEALHDRPWPDEVPLRAFRRPDTRHRHLVRLPLSGPGGDAGRDRLDRVLSRLRDVSLMTDGTHRKLVNACIETRPRAEVVPHPGDVTTRDAERTAPELA